MNGQHIEESNGRDRLLDAAQALFAENGFSDVSINEIAIAAGMTRSAPYYHFKNKEELYVAVLVRQISGFFKLIEEKTEAAPSFRGQLHAIIEVSTMVHGSSFGRSKEDFRAHVSPEVRRSIAAQLKDPKEIFIPIFKRAFDSGEFSRTDPTTAFQTFFMMLIGYMETLTKRGECAPGPFRMAAPAAESFVDIFLHGI